MFEGARRVAKVSAVLIAVGFGYVMFTEQTDPLSVSYLISSPDNVPVRVDECSATDSTLSFRLTSRGGVMLTIQICNPTPNATVEEYAVWIIKNADKKGTADFEAVAAEYEAVRGDYRYAPLASSESGSFQESTLSKYLDEERRGISTPEKAAVLNEALNRALRSAQERVEITRKFTIPEADEGYITRSAWFQVARNTGALLLQMLASLAGFWAFTWTCGWIVRGFMGIPHGLDQSE